MSLTPDRYEVILLINNSVDGSASVAGDFAQRHPCLALHVVEVDLPAGDAHVGRARRILMDAAAERLPATGVIATTDADTIVAPTWIATMLAEFAGEADAVFGRILVDPSGFAEHGRYARRNHLLDVTYRYLVAELEARLAPDQSDPWPCHFQHFGPSMAVTVAAYRRAGGIPPLPWLEDVALYDALRRTNARIRHSPHVRVVTSARAEGRTGFGFAGQLRQWAEMGALGEPLLVESLEGVVERTMGRQSVASLDPIDVAIRDLRRYLAGLRTGHANSIRALEQIDSIGLLAVAD